MEFKYHGSYAFLFTVVIYLGFSICESIPVVLTLSILGSSLGETIEALFMFLLGYFGKSMLIVGVIIVK